ncbi:uncharacterized protein PGTG_09002 [Puccinia graminis f. sp. tritici CRL 75-36-700-3]|uniref:Uncharacterized protein n=1 Tax=Puccinia graminis f. sp. tritici (strain CRL 75-36-700-3 / race SCCL) TaxID=418459 RepID=E3KE68_PUCGT|nr:uncharacterized protein PGTG_09002 [Puccinia graminis f. sp. tritici CRL 75-36-700-3]EFP82806.2 hypothetical protein PGTG_09002 [Puccinia graminis f. sp. tritici CRL 75-36-700-3]
MEALECESIPGRRKLVQRLSYLVVPSTISKMPSLNPWFCGGKLWKQSLMLFKLKI